jgi:epsilon-lactone hydrolase
MATRRHSGFNRQPARLEILLSHTKQTPETLLNRQLFHTFSFPFSDLDNRDQAVAVLLVTTYQSPFTNPGISNRHSARLEIIENSTKTRFLAVLIDTFLRFLGPNQRRERSGSGARTTSHVVFNRQPKLLEFAVTSRKHTPVPYFNRNRSRVLSHYESKVREPRIGVRVIQKAPSAAGGDVCANGKLGADMKGTSFNAIVMIGVLIVVFAFVSALPALAQVASPDAAGARAAHATMKTAQAAASGATMKTAASGSAAKQTPVRVTVPSGGPGALCAPPETDTSFIAADGTAHVTRVVPVPATISPEAQKMLARVVADVPDTQTLAEHRASTDAWQKRAGEESLALYPAKISADTIAGVPVRVVTPENGEAVAGRVLINVHGGGFQVDSGSLTESIPIANLTHIKVISVLYRMAPEHPFPAAVDDTVAVYKELLKSYAPEKIALYGTSAGAILTAEVAVRLRELKLPLPGALGIFSGMGDYSRPGDSEAIYALGGFSGHLDVPEAGARRDPYVGATNPRDPVLSPVFADVHGFPPTLFITSTRDLLLSGTTILHRHFLGEGVDARLVVFEALPHAFWNNPSLPESKEADAIMAGFFVRELGR